MCVCVCAGTQECPSGVVNEETFKYIYAQFFPQGGQSVRQSLLAFLLGSCANKPCPENDIDWELSMGVKIIIILLLIIIIIINVFV